MAEGWQHSLALAGRHGQAGWRSNDAARLAGMEFSRRLCPRRWSIRCGVLMAPEKLKRVRGISGAGGVSSCEGRHQSSTKRNKTQYLQRIMKKLKLTLAAGLATVAAFVSVMAAEAVMSPRAAANAPRVTASAGHTTHAVPQPAMGCSRGHSTHSDSKAPSSAAAADAHCQTAKKVQSHKSCCS